MHRRKPSKSQSSINVTPLADVSLSLLLGFLVITPVIFQTLATKLPQGGGVASGQVREDPKVEFTAERKILINKEEVTEEELPAVLRKLFPPGAAMERKVMFTGSGEIPYQKVVYLLDLLKKHGVETIGIH